MDSLEKIIGPSEEYRIESPSHRGIRMVKGLAKGKSYDELLEIMLAVILGVMKVGKAEDYYGVMFGSNRVTESDVVTHSNRGQTGELWTFNRIKIPTAISFGINQGYIEFYDGRNWCTQSKFAYLIDRNCAELRLTNKGREIYENIDLSRVSRS